MDPWEDSITENSWEDLVTEDPKEVPITEDPKQSLPKKFYQVCLVVKKV